MVATQTVPQYLQHCNFISITPRHGVVTLFGYGIKVFVDRGHLAIQDGIGANRREGRLSRVGHGLRRLVVVGSDGMVSLAALRWLADQDAAFIMLDRDGSVLVTTGPVRPSDARLRRAQSLAHDSGAALKIAIELVRQKLIGQERIVREQFQNEIAVETIARARSALMGATSSEEIRRYEAQAALAYWTAWHEMPVNYPRADLLRVPEHWKTFGSRLSPLTKSPRLAVNPPNAILNYLYAILESEARLAISELGLDPGIGGSPQRRSHAGQFGLRPHGTDSPESGCVPLGLAAPCAITEEMVFRTNRWKLSIDRRICCPTVGNVKDLEAGVGALRRVDSSHALVDHIASGPSEGSSHAPDATAKTGGERDSDNYANRAWCESANLAPGLCPDDILRKPFGITMAGPAEFTRSDSANAPCRDPTATGGCVESLEFI